MIKRFIFTLVFLFLPSVALAAGGNTVSGADTAWLLVSTALVMLMTPGLAFFYGGMVRSRNVLNTLMMSLVALGVITLQWVIIGYSLAFGHDIWHLIGGLDHIFLRGVGMDPSPVYATTVPQLAFMAFQMMFAIITPALISGALVERMKFSSYVLFILLWATLVYDPICHWVWGNGGWLARLGALDFAGGTVVHINAGISALAAALVLGKRKGFLREPIMPNNVVLTAIGAGLLWFGWFGFNAGSALTSGRLSSLAFVNTHVAAATAALSWIAVEYIQHRRFSTIGFCSGLVAGLVAITPAAGFVNILGAIFIGATVGVICYGAVVIKMKLGYDDSLDAFGVHGIGGLWGALATGLVAAVGAKGLFTGSALQFGKQVLASGVTIVYAFVVTFIILKALDATVGLRVDAEVERTGLDLELHGEEGYKI